MAHKPQVLPEYAGGTNQTTYSVGDILYCSEANVLTKLSAGDSTDIATIENSLPIWSPNSGGFRPQVVSGSSVDIDINIVYVIENATLVTLTLPSNMGQGKTFKIVGKGAAGWKIAQRAGQTIYYNLVSTLTGILGSLSSSSQYNVVEIMNITADTEWIVTNAIGNLTVV